MATIKDFFVRQGAQATTTLVAGAGLSNQMTLAGGVSGSPGVVSLTASGTDPNINVNIVTKGSGTFTVNGASIGLPGGSSGQIQYNNGGVFGGIATTGSGNVVLATAPTVIGGSFTSLTGFSLRNIGTGAFDATILHNGTLTAGRTLSLNISDANRALGMFGDVTFASNFTTVGANSLTLTTTAATNVTLPTAGTLATLAGVETFTNKTLTTPQINAATVGTSAAVTAGTNAQGQGALTSDINVITTNASNPGGVTLPTATTGRWVSVINKSANPVNIYPAVGATIDTGAANASIPLPAGGKLEFLAYSTTAWASSATGAKGNGLLTLAGNLTTSGAFATTFTMTGATSVTFPTAGTLMTTTGNTTGSAGSVVNALTINNGGAGAASGSTFNGSAAVTLSYNSIGAPSTTGTGASGTWGISISGTATNATNIAVSNDVANASTVFPLWATGTSSGTAATISSTKLTFVPSTGVLSATSFTGAGTGLTGTAASLSIGGNAATATSATTAGSVTNVVTFNNSGAGAGSGSTFNGSSGLTVSHNTIGAVALAGSTMTGSLTLSSDPTQPLHAATKQYVDATATGLDVKSSVRAASTASFTVTYANGASGVGATLTNAGAQAALAMDGVSLAANDRVLIKNQASAFQNGVYTVTTVGSGATNWVLTRTTDADTATEVTPGMFTFVEEGTTLAGTGWILTSTGATTMGTTNLPFTQFSAAGVATAGNGIIQLGNVFHFASSSNYTTGSLFYASGSTTVGQLADAATGNVLLSGGAGAAPTYGKVVIDTTAGTSHVSGTLQVGSGGTGATTISGLVFGNGTSAMTAATGAQIATALGATNISGNAANVTGIVATANGGTGANLSLTQFGAIVANTTTAMISTGAGTVGQVLAANTAAIPSFQTLNLTYLPDAWVKRAVKAATTATVTLAGGAPSTVDGVALVLNDRILVKNQSTAAQNGIYSVTTVGTGANGTWTRVTDANTSAFIGEATVAVDQGTVAAGKLFRTTFTPINTLDTTAMNWYEVLDASLIGNASYVPSTTGTGASGTWGISISGNAATATTATSATNTTNIGITDDNATAASVFPTWVTANSGNLPNKVSSTKLSFNPSTGILTATGGFAGTATASSTSTIVDDTTTNASMFLGWYTANTGNLPTKVTSTKLTFNPSTGVLTATGGFSGNATTATTATTATNVTVTANNSTNASFFPAFYSATSGNLGTTASTGLTFNPSTGTLTSTNFSTSGTTTTGVVSYGSNASITTGSASVTTTSATTVDTWATGTYRSARYTVQIVDGTLFETADMLIVHDGTTAYVTTFGNVFTGSFSLGAFDASISAGTLSLTYTATAATTKTVKFTRQVITV